MHVWILPSTEQCISLIVCVNWRLKIVTMLVGCPSTGNLSLPHFSITPPAWGVGTWGQSYCRRHESPQAKKCVSKVLRSSSSACSTWGLPFSHTLLQIMPHPNSGLLPVSMSLVAILITSLHTHGVWALAAVARWVPAYYHKFLDWSRKSRLCLSR
jgi:hypothetical protein